MSYKHHGLFLFSPTVDGSEIRRSPVDKLVVYHMIYRGFMTIQTVVGLGMSSINNFTWPCRLWYCWWLQKSCDKTIEKKVSKKNTGTMIRIEVIPSLKLTWHLKIGNPKRKFIFQPSIFRCYVSFRECISRGRQLGFWQIWVGIGWFVWCRLMVVRHGEPVDIQNISLNNGIPPWK